ncbi:hypothetical protein [Salibacterium halotolerans]|uniref:Uncharacterized protein n=1 Tax=Salibacterium halotolerans TaxID=1884432 RepID=A0A1I5X5K6_9BACI|nr:hypothetical protein [Salibacterium halotolerans]SFQ27273.1 hypothetical protein SAMN05518683_12514 [Salibacterium halotolerans]
MKAVWIGAAVLVVITLVASMIGATTKLGNIIGPVVGCIISSAILIGLMTWENKKGAVSKAIKR